MTRASTSHEMIFGAIIPATQEAFKSATKGGVSKLVRVKESKSLVDFKALMSQEIEKNKPPSCFPTAGQVFVAVIQFYTSRKKDYNKRDVDNMAKTILDVLKQNGFYNDDNQVRTLLVSKRVDLSKVPQNLGYIYVKILSDNEDIKVVGSRVTRALSLYSSLKAGKIAIAD